MISIEKFLKLEPDVRLRKLWRLLHVYESDIRGEIGIYREAAARLQNYESHRFFAALSHAISTPLSMLGSIPATESISTLGSTVEDPANLTGLRTVLFEILQCLTGGAGTEIRVIERLLFAVNATRHRISRSLGREAAEWDLFARVNPGATGSGFANQTSASSTLIPPAAGKAVYCDDIRSPFNVGSVFRTALAFGFAKVYLSPACPSPLHPRAERSAMGAVAQIPWIQASIDEALNDMSDPDGKHVKPVFALEQGGEDIDSFDFPQTGLVVIGSEELGVSPGILERCGNEAGIVSVRLPGPKASLNVASAFAILAHCWARN